jgi:hypothetical protein
MRIKGIKLDKANSPHLFVTTSQSIWIIQIDTATSLRTLKRALLGPLHFYFTSGNNSLPNKKKHSGNIATHNSIALKLYATRKPGIVSTSLYMMRMT